MKSTFGTALVVVVATASPAAQQAGGQTPPRNPAMNQAMSDADFLRKAAEGGTKEVTLGKLAADKATRADVKTFAQKMVKDHGQANDELMKLAKSEGVTINAEQNSTEASRVAADLGKTTGAAFDQAYVNMMLKDHQDTVELFTHQATHGKDPEVKAWATKMLPALREHLKEVEKLKGA